MTDLVAGSPARNLRDAKSHVARDNIAGTVMAGIVVSIALLGGIGGWVATTSLSGAVIAGGTVVVDSNVKKVQHPTGGIIGEIAIRNGDRVEAGDVLARLDQTLPRASLEILAKQLDRVRMRMSRLAAEATGADTIQLPDAFRDRRNDDDIVELFGGERRLFEARRRSFTSQKTALEARNEQYRRQIEGLNAQRQAAEQSLVLLERDMVTVRDLFERKLIPLERISSLEMNIAQQKGEIGRLTSAAAEAEGRITENALQVIQLEDAFRRDASLELRELEGREAELVERLQVAQDQLARTIIRAPQSGYVQELAVHTIGGVISPGETLMTIVPESDDLVIDAQISPARIDEVEAGQPVVIRFSAFDRNVTPECHGTVSRVSPDLIRNETLRMAYYEARIVIDDENECLAEGMRLLPGMPVEVHVQTGERQVLSYLLKPITDQLMRALRE